MEWIAAKFFGSSLPGMGAVSAETVRKYLAGIRSRHVDMALNIDIFRHPSIKRMLSGATSINPALGEPRIKKPITKAQLDVIVPGEAASVSYIDNVNLSAAYSLMFAGFLRLGEITYTKVEADAADFQYIHATRSDISFGPDFYHFRLKRSKTDVEKLGVVITVAATGGPACPYAAMARLFREDPRERSEPLFRSSYSKSFTPSYFMTNLIRRMVSLGINTEKITGHSFRYGAAQHAKECGLTDHEIQCLGRWTSDVFKIYCGTSLSERLALNYKFQSGQCRGLGYVKNADSKHPISLGSLSYD